MLFICVQVGINERSQHITDIAKEVFDAIEQDFNETRFSEILTDMEKPPADATPYERICNLSRVCYMNGVIDGMEIMNALSHDENAKMKEVTT